MKKFLLSLAVFVASGTYIVYLSTGGNSSSSALATNVQTPTTVSTPPQTTTTQPTPEQNQTTPTPAPTQTPTQNPTQTNTPSPVATPPPVTKPKGQYVDGTYTGSAADAYYGTVQVKATIQGGKLTDVTFLQYPNDRSTSRYINSQAMPQLKSEAIQAQSANVSGVSGASDTSQAFIQSLGDALAQAKNS
jgi:uncharacterized protein with FMN-binding domain